MLKTFLTVSSITVCLFLLSGCNLTVTVEAPAKTPVNTPPVASSYLNPVSFL